MRVFVALDVPEETGQALGSLIRKLEKAASGARWVRAEGIHITLKFIGEIDGQTVEQVKRQLAEVRSAEPVNIAFRDFGFFPDDRHPRVFWVGLDASANLAELAADLEARLERLGIPREARPFRAHLTLARFRSVDGLPRLREALDRVTSREFGATTASEFHLYRSTLKPSGAEYTRLESYRFVKDAS